MADKHKVVFEWPHPEPTEVIVAGSFNDWARTCYLTKAPTGFTGSAYVPWGSKITYKYIVDGTWTTNPDQPTEPDHDGNINHMYIAPPQPESRPNGNGKLAPAEAPDTTTGSLPQLVAHLADTVIAREGTSSALGYVASGFGAAFNSVVGVDLINAEQIAIPTPLQTAATAMTEFDVPGSAVSDGAPLSSVPAKMPFSPQQPAFENTPASEDLKAVSTSEPPAKVASNILVPIVPVNAAENNMVSTPALEPVVTPAEYVQDVVMEKKNDQLERSTHTAVNLINGNVPVEDVTNKAEVIPVIVEGLNAAINPAAKSVPADKQDTSQVLDVPMAAATAVADEPSLVASADRASTPEEPSEASKSPEATIPASDLNPSSLTSEEIPIGAARSATPEETPMSQYIPAAPLQRELDKLEQTKSEPGVDEVKAEPAPVPVLELSSEMSDVAVGPVATEIAPQSAAKPEAKREKEELASGSAPVEVLASHAPQNAAEDGTEPSVEPVSVKQGEKVPKSELKAEMKEVESTSAPIRDFLPTSEPESAPVVGEQTLASTVEAAPTKQVAVPATGAVPSEPTSPVADATPAEPIPPSTTKAALTEPVLAPTTQTAPTELAPTSATKITPLEPVLKTEALPAPTTEVVPTTPATSESAPASPPSEPVAVIPSNSHVKEVTSPAPAPAVLVKEAFPSIASPAASPSKSEKAVPARKKKSSIFGKIKHFFESDKSKK